MYDTPIPTKNPQGPAMIHRIRIENFYSIRESQTLDLRVPGTAPDDPRFRPSLSRPDVRLPTVVALYGANASGKSTVLRAVVSLIRFMVDSFDNPIDGGIPDFEPFLSAATASQPTRLSAEFDASWIEGHSTLHRYELHIANHGPDQPRTVAYEALHHAPKRHFVRVFERRENTVITGAPLGLKPDDPRLSVRPNASVIATLAKFNHDVGTRIWKNLDALPTNFVGHQRRSPDHRALLRHYAQNPRHLDRLNEVLPRFDLGLAAMRIEQGADGLTAVFQHRGLDKKILFQGESQGTQRFVRTFPWIFRGLEGGWPIFMDELDADLHTRLLAEIIRWFHKTQDGKEPATNPFGAQLFLTAHNPALLDELEKEEVFFTEKDQSGATTIYGAKDIQGLRREPSLSRKYLGGALGAVPRIG